MMKSKKASELAVKAGVTYVKTGTGWGPKPTTVDTIKIIKETIGDDALIKAAGGVKDLDTVIEMIKAGCNRFGLGVRTAGTILEDAKNRFKINIIFLLKIKKRHFKCLFLMMIII